MYVQPSILCKKPSTSSKVTFWFWEDTFQFLEEAFQVVPKLPCKHKLENCSKDSIIL